VRSMSEDGERELSRLNIQDADVDDNGYIEDFDGDTLFIYLRQHTVYSWSLINSRGDEKYDYDVS